MYASPLKNAKVITPRSRTAAGTPAASTSVPRGREPAKGRDEQRDADDRAADDEHELLRGERGDRSPAPAAASSASGRRRIVAAAAACSSGGAAAGIRRRAVTRQPARDGEQRQQPQEHQPPRRELADDRRDRRPDHARAPPTRSTAARTSAAGGAAGACGRSPRTPSAPTAPPPRPWTNRAATRTRIVGASPPIVSPTANSTSPMANGRHSGTRSSAPPATHDAQQVAQEERRVDPAVELDLAELFADQRQHGPDRQRLEGDQRDRRDEPDRQAAQAGREQLRGARGHHGRCCGGGRRGHDTIMPGPPHTGGRRAMRAGVRQMT